ncbi:ABC transporter permease [Anoxybacillus ayderensis]|uniref:nickel transporter permease n=1 Tax=Anoxybacillus sp. ST70 TaxID=2864180 RepID=UPI0002D9C43C|nr:nickel transporter permease [Anoxybacillus sp. ST70]AXM90174.1 ABC transporter permease [Anoxybacillus ayderensis G10]MBW9218890.1 ABC transporter permease [Anoxybacillus sp. ST70]THD17642.1 ABC transporter permease [Anoxybacillus ayderensis]
MIKFKRAYSKKRALFPLAILLMYILVIFIAPIFAPSHSLNVDMNNRFAPMSMNHLLGTDHLGRDVLSRLLEGGRVTVGVSFLSLLLILMISIPLGVLSGFLGGAFDRFCMRTVNSLLAFPDIIIAIVLAGLLGPSLFNIVIAVIVAKCGSYIRVVRSIILSEKEKNYIIMAIVGGARTLYILRKHFFPHILSHVTVMATIDLGKIILMIASLSYIGLGAQPPTPEWGMMLNECSAYFHNAPHLMIFPGAAIMCTVLLSNFVGDQLRDNFSLETNQH